MLLAAGPAAHQKKHYHHGGGGKGQDDEDRQGLRIHGEASTSSTVDAFDDDQDAAKRRRLGQLPQVGTGSAEVSDGERAATEIATWSAALPSTVIMTSMYVRAAAESVARHASDEEFQPT